MTSGPLTSPQVAVFSSVNPISRQRLTGLPLREICILIKSSARPVENKKAGSHIFNGRNSNGRPRERIGEGATEQWTPLPTPCPRLPPHSPRPAPPPSAANSWNRLFSLVTLQDLGSLPPLPQFSRCYQGAFPASAWQWGVVGGHPSDQVRSRLKPSGA